MLNVVLSRIIREALGLPHRDRSEVLAKRRSARRTQIETIIIEAEMVAYKKGTGIDGAQGIYEYEIILN